VSPAVRRALIVAAAALVLGVVGGLVAKKERIRRDGAVAFLRLAPIDPRSLMQGDYMALRFALANEIEAMLRRGAAPEVGDEDEEEGVRPASGEQGAGSAVPAFARALGEGGFAFAPVRLDERGVASLAVGDPAALRFRYRLRGGRPWLGTNAFFFREGEAARYRDARYGEFRVDRESGEAVLVGLRDEALRPL
jgi:uncharacterized membrane-anchored protein